jgi:hypothetical protein
MLEVRLCNDQEQRPRGQPCLLLDRYADLDVVLGQDFWVGQLVLGKRRSGVPVASQYVDVVGKQIWPYSRYLHAKQLGVKLLLRELIEGETAKHVIDSQHVSHLLRTSQVVYSAVVFANDILEQVLPQFRDLLHHTKIRPLIDPGDMLSSR